MNCRNCSMPSICTRSDVLQALDTGGKDGTIRLSSRASTRKSVRVSSFKAPSQEEPARLSLAVHRNTPAEGEIVIFNRSHYEDVLVTRVHKLISKEQLQKRFQQINNLRRCSVKKARLLLNSSCISTKMNKKTIGSNAWKTPRNSENSVSGRQRTQAVPEYKKVMKSPHNTATDYAPGILSGQ